MKFWRLEVPFAIPGLVWNMMMSMSGGWFFVVASEAISVGNTTVTLPGIGSYIAVAIEKRDLSAVYWAIGTMAIVILIYDQLLFRPLVAWADRFRPEQQPGVEPPRSWVLTVFQRSSLIRIGLKPLKRLWESTFKLAAALPAAPAKSMWLGRDRSINAIWLGMLGLGVTYTIWSIVRFVVPAVSLHEVGWVAVLSSITLLRVVILITLASVIWVPVGVIVGLSPKLTRVIQPIAQFLAAFPANLFFPLAVVAIVTYKLNPDVWLSPLMILGTQWYILFNVIAGAAVMPRELLDAGASFHVGGWAWWRNVALPAVIPYYLTGAITASGGSFNASIVSEAVSWGDDKLVAHGIGSYIADATAKGDFQRIVLGVAVMCVFVVILNRSLWRPLYHWVETRFRLD
jgi:NitT/TauT family transport system permease protein